MKNIFLDTNVIIDFLANRQPFSIYAAKLFNYSFLKKAKIYVSAVSYNNIYYILKQSLPNKETIELLNELSEMVDGADVTKSVISKTLKTDFKDFEDAIQYYCALSLSKIDFIVTRDTKDFKKSSIPVLTPTEAISLLENIDK
ncbi:MAG: PIN domain-containing protein [Chitinophagaceae bacterium]|nr:PIN domain-containing protein [Chitinophagaceae bacterium]